MQKPKLSGLKQTSKIHKHVQVSEDMQHKESTEN